MRLIDADELITAFPCGESVRTECVRATINNMPTIEVSEDDLYIPLNNQTVERINRLHKDECGEYFDEEWLFNELEQISEFREVSEDCISRADLIESFLADSECKREEAISELETIKRVYANMRKEYKPCVEALQMAVDLLKQADTPQTDKTCDNCGTPRDKCVFCIEEDRMWTPQTDIHGLTDCDFCKGEDCEDCEGGKDEPQIFTWGKEVHEFCKMKCNKSKARLFDGDRFIVCGQSNDSICINLPACPLGKWITGKGYHILPMDELQTEREGE